MNMAGLQQVRFLSGSSSVVITEGDGSIAYYHRTSTGSAFTTPAGSSEQLVYTGTVYRRYGLDSSYVEFNAAGRMTSSVDRHGNATTITYASLDSVPTRIADPMGKYIDLCFGDTGLCYTGKLLRVRVLSATTGVREANYLINSSGQLIRITDPDGYSDSLSYGTNSLIATAWDRARQRTDYAFDALMRVSQVQGPSVTLWNGTSSRPTVTQVSADFVTWQPGTPGVAQVSPKATVKGDTVAASISDPMNSITRARVDRFGGATKVIDPYGAVTTIVRDTEGRATRITTPDGHSVQYWYAGYVVYQAWDNTTGQVINYTYRPNSNYLLKISGDAVRQDFLYTTSNGGTQRALSKIYLNSTGAPGTAVGAQLVAWHKPDLRGRDTAVVDSLGFGPHYSYDATWGSVRTTKDPTLKNVSTVSYDDRGRVVKSVSPLSGADSVVYGTMNQVVWSRTGLGLVTNYAYDPVTLLLTQLNDPKGQINKFSYNSLGALTRQYAVGSSTVADSVGYDAVGRAVRIWRQGPLAIELTYDKVGRPTSRTVPGAVTDYYLYDTLTAHWQVAYNDNARDSLYVDLTGRKRNASTRIGARTYTSRDSLNQMGQFTGYVMTDEAGGYSQTVASRYSGAGLADTLCIELQCMWIQRGPNLATSVALYDSASNWLTRWSMVQTVDESRRVTSQNYSPAALAPFDAMWTRDSVSRVKSRGPLTGGSAIDFTYDLDGRLTKACGPSELPCVIGPPLWTYDAAGNRIENGVTTSYGAANDVTRRGGEAYQYDANGNLVCRYPYGQSCAFGQAGKRYTYDAMGRLTLVENLINMTVLASYGYDALDRRVIRRVGNAAAGTELHIHYGNQVVMDIDSVTGQRRSEYAWIPGEVDRLFAVKAPVWGTGWNLAITDPNIGTVRGVARFAGGGILKKYSEVPWGDATADTGVKVRFRFAGASFEPETGLYYMRARFYEPGLGRFLTEDPIGINGGANLFAYAANDPINTSDPSGTSLQCTNSYHPGYDYEEPGPAGFLPTIVSVAGKWVRECHDVPEPGGATGVPMGGSAAAGTTQITQVDKKDCKEEWVSLTISAVSDAVPAIRTVRAIRALRQGGRIAAWGTWNSQAAHTVGRAMERGARATIRLENVGYTTLARNFTISLTTETIMEPPGLDASSVLLGAVPYVGSGIALVRALQCQF
jgi:RHS repeat-associated protein